MANMNSIGDYIRQQREQAKISLRQLADQAGVSNPYLSQIERGLRKPSADILQQIAKGLRISAEALYVQAGILEDHPGDSGVRSALLTDPQLTERQKQVLIEIYESFRKEGQKAPTAEVVAVLRGDRPVPGADVRAAAASASAASAPADGPSSAAPAGHAATQRPGEFPGPSAEADIPPADPAAAEPPNGDSAVPGEPPAGPSSSWGDATDAV